jgi:methionyl aminopeptidase
MTSIKTPAEIAILRQGGKILARILQTVAAEVKPGATTFELNELAEKLIHEAGGVPSFKNYGYPPYPAGLCTSVNAELVHGIPSKEVILKDGDIISLDIGMKYPAASGLYTDMAVTIPVGKVGDEVKNLITVTKKALQVVEQHLRPGIDLQYISGLIQDWVERNGFGVIRDLVGHGVGYQVHEEPQVPNYVIPNFHLTLKPGMVLAFEPMVSAGNYDVLTKEDGWTVETVDKSLTAHFEHTFVVTENGNEVITRE